MPLPSIPVRIAAAIGAQPTQLSAAIELLDGGATVPFVARYRKEATGGLDDVQLRGLDTLLSELRELEARRAAVLTSIRESGALTPELEAELLAADTRERIEDLFLPYRPKYRSRAQIAREAGLGPLADALLSDPTLVPSTLSSAFLSPSADVPYASSALRVWVSVSSIKISGRRKPKPSVPKPNWNCAAAAGSDEADSARPSTVARMTVRDFMSSSFASTLKKQSPAVARPGSGGKPREEPAPAGRWFRT